VFKSPISEEFKKSKAGKLKLILHKGEYKTVPIDLGLICLDKNCLTEKDELVEVFRNGKLLKDWKFSEIRERVLDKK